MKTREIIFCLTLIGINGSQSSAAEPEVPSLALTVIRADGKPVKAATASVFWNQYEAIAIEGKPVEAKSVPVEAGKTVRVPVLVSSEYPFEDQYV
ncbi:MAG: hypothetical protein ACRCZF_09340, partial [Gemmataceae bacterium]